MHNCNKLVTIEYTWAHERHYACTEHASQVEKLSNLLGLSTCPRFITSDKLCNNQVKDEVKV